MTDKPGKTAKALLRRRLLATAFCAALSIIVQWVPASAQSCTANFTDANFGAFGALTTAVQS